jgi:hypothetical protein
MTAARIGQKDDPEAAATHVDGTAAARVTREDELGSAAIPGFGQAAAPGTREGDGVSCESGLKSAARRIV